MHPVKLEIESNRAISNWTNKEKFARLLWAMSQPLFFYSPRLLWTWRVALLRLFGAKIGKNVHIYPTVQVFAPWNLEIADWASIGFDALLYNLGPIRIGARSTISQRAHLCAGSHDYRGADMRLLKLPINIGDDVWVCADSFVGPDISVGDGAVIGACAVVVKNVLPWTVVAGNPAIEKGKRTLCNQQLGEGLEHGETNVR
jgi:putative colanic acid biosynthesis acetyltransferase WcaF